MITALHPNASQGTNNLTIPYGLLEGEMKSLSLAVVFIVASATFAHAQYQHGWKNYEKPQPGYTYGARETNPYGPGGSKSYGPGGGKNLTNRWKPIR